MKGYVNLTHTNNSAIKEVSQKVDNIEDNYITKDTSELTNYYTKNQTYTKEEIDNKTTNVYRAKGSVQTYQDLPTENNQVGDVYNVIEAYEDYPAGTNFVWTDTSTWDALGGEISIIEGVSQEDFDALVNNKTQIKNPENPDLLLIGGATRRYGFTTAGIGIGQNASIHTNGNIAIGKNSSATNYGSIAIGENSSATNSNIALGYNSESSASDAIQIGRGTNTIADSFQIRNDNIYKSDTHTLTVQNAEINGTPAYGVLSGTSAPTTTTVGAVGQFYLDTTNKQLYQCMSITQESVDEVDTNVYEWSKIGSQEILTGSTNPTSTTAGELGQLYIQTDINQNVKIWQCCKSNINSYSWINIGGTNAYSFSNSFMAGGAWNAGRKSVAIGPNADASGDSSVQLLDGINTTSNSFQIADDNIYKTNTHTLTVNNIEQNGNPVYAVLQGTTAPDTTTVGAVTQFYLNTIDKKLYQCKSITTSETDSTSTYEWQEVGGSSEKKYMHCLTFKDGFNVVFFTNIITNNSSPMSKLDFLEWLRNNGYEHNYSTVSISEAIGYPVSGGIYSFGRIYDSVFADSNSDDYMCYRSIELNMTSLIIDKVEYRTINNDTSLRLSKNRTIGGSIQDNVIEL